MARSLLLVTSLLVTGCNALAASAWQKRLDRAVLDVDLTLEQRVRNLQRVAQDPAVREDVKAAFDAVRENGFAKGHPELIDRLWPVGTTARDDLEGLRALQKQVPEILQDAQSRPAPQPPKADPAELRDAAKQISQAIFGLREPEKRAEIEEEIKNAFRSTPKGLETPAYTVERAFADVEVRAYAPYAVAKLEAPSTSGEGFNTLAAFLFGKNSEDRAMSMTMPVEMTDGRMAFVLPKADEAAPPAPLDASVTIEQRAARSVASVSFAGVATPEEVERQTDRLFDALDAEGGYEYDAAEATVLQYNAPYTLPWRRRNELVVPVTAAGPAAPAASAPASSGSRAAANTEDYLSSL